MKLLKKVFTKSDRSPGSFVEDGSEDDSTLERELDMPASASNQSFAYSVDSYAPSAVTSPHAKVPGPQPDMLRSAAEAAGAPGATPPAIYQPHVPQPPAPPAGTQQAAASLPSPPRDHVAPKSYESVTIAVGRNCPPGLRRDVWHVNDFDLRKLMYNGAISIVYHAVDKRSGITVALKLYKRIKLNEIERHQVAREIRLHADLAHDSIIAMYAAWKDRAYVYLALEWAPGGDVYSYLKSQRGRLAEELAVPLILEPFMAGLSVIHDKGLIHRDIKPENMLLTNSFQVKIADFGLSIDSKQEIANTRLGTIDYLAPEILDCPVKQHPEDHKDRPDTGYTNKVDCWSVGVLAYELLVGAPPFAAPTAQETLRLIRTKRVEYPTWLSADSVNFMSSVLVRNPLERPSIAELLQHPWILKYSRREGGGLARARHRMLQRRPTMDGGMLGRSNTSGDLAPLVAAQKQQQLQQQQMVAAAQQLTSPAAAAAAVSAAAAAAAAAAAGVGTVSAKALAAGGGHLHSPHHAGGGGNGGHPPHALQHSHTYGHGHALTAGPYHSSNGGSGSLSGGVSMHSQPLPVIHPSGGSASAASLAHAHAHAAGNGNGNGNGNGYESAHGMVIGSPAGGGGGLYSVPLPGGGGGSSGGAVVPPPPVAAAPQAVAAAAPAEKSIGSLSRKLKFWSVATGGSSGGGGGGGAPALEEMRTPSGRVIALPPVNGGQQAAPAPAPGLFARLVRPGSSKNNAAAAVQPQPPAAAVAVLAPGSPRGSKRPMGLPEGLEGAAAAFASGGSASGAVPPVIMDAPGSPMSRKGSLLRPV